MDRIQHSYWTKFYCSECKCHTLIWCKITRLLSVTNFIIRITKIVIEKEIQKSTCTARFPGSYQWDRAVTMIYILGTHPLLLSDIVKMSILPILHSFSSLPAKLYSHFLWIPSKTPLTNSYERAVDIHYVWF